MNITTATNKREKVKQQAYVTMTYEKLAVECPMIIINKLIYDGIIGIDLLNVLDAKIDISNNKIICNYKGVQHNVKMNEEERQYKVSKTTYCLN